MFGNFRWLQIKDLHTVNAACLPKPAVVKRTSIIETRSQATKANESSKFRGSGIYQVQIGYISIFCEISFYEKTISHCISW